MQKPSKECLDGDELHPRLLKWIAQKNLWNLWVPREYGGLQSSLSDGLEILSTLAKWEGSLGWTVTLCSGANYFVGNLEKEKADELFLGDTPPVFGGSGAVGGTAERREEGYLISGIWKYATGAPYLTHFTLNAKVWENGKELRTEDGQPIVQSFILRKDQVEIIKDWNTMGLRATATHSFQVRSQYVERSQSFVYNKVYHSNPIFKIPFSVFADLTLWANYLGLAEHFLEEAHIILGSLEQLNILKATLTKAYNDMRSDAHTIESWIGNETNISESYITEIHRKATYSVQNLTEAIIRLYPLLGIRGASEDHKINKIFKDFFTATQHHIFSPMGRRGSTKVFKP